MGRRRGRGGPCGVLLVDKPDGPTSHDVVGWARKALGTRAVGHCGTLDPAATGLLVLCVGDATKLVPYLSGADKAYRACFVLGVSTNSADREGEVLERVEVPSTVVDATPAAVQGLEGAHQLPPPVFSSVHVDGERAHAKARRGEVVELEPRPMTVHWVRDVAVDTAGGTVVVDATLQVSKGTYIRSLAVELGRRLGVPAHLGALRRTRSGAFSVEDPGCLHPAAVRRPPPEGDRAPQARIRWAFDPPPDADPRGVAGALRSPAEAVPFQRLALDGGAESAVFAQRLTHGQAVPVGVLPGDPGPIEGDRIAVTEPGGGLLVARVDRSAGYPVLRPERTVVPLVRGNPTAP